MVWPIVTYCPNIVNLGPQVQRYHAATGISTSLMHLFFYLNVLHLCTRLSVYDEELCTM